MFGWNDVFKFILSFFIIFPVVTFIHLIGHIFFVAISGGTGKKIIIGCGKKMVSLWKIEIRKFYFMSGGCEFIKLRRDTKLNNSFIYLGGSLFNIISIFVVNFLIKEGVLEASTFWYQFIYFSFYVVFFALFPMDYADGSPSDGKAFWLNLKDKDNKFTDDIRRNSEY